MIRDQYERQITQYERLFHEQSHKCEVVKELCDAKDRENLGNKRKLMFYEGTLHSRGLMEEFRGYLQGSMQPNTTTPMSTKKLYKTMIDMAFNSFSNNSIISCIVHDMFQCMKIDYNHLSDEEKMNASNQLTQELVDLYSILSQSIHGMKKARHDQQFIICSYVIVFSVSKKENKYFLLFLFRKNLNDNQICLIKCIAIHFLRLDQNDIRIEEY